MASRMGDVEWKPRIGDRVKYPTEQGEEIATIRYLYMDGRGLYADIQADSGCIPHVHVDALEFTGQCVQY